MKKFFVFIFAVGAIALIGLTFFPSCNVTRKLTTESSYFQKGDTSVHIVTKTTETYDASKKSLQ